MKAKIQVYEKLFFALAFFIFLSGNIYFYAPQIDILKNQKEYNLIGTDDRRLGGNSRLEYKLTPDALTFTFQKGDAIEGPYVAVFFEKKDSSFFELEDYTATIKGEINGGGFFDFRLEIKPYVPFKENPPYYFNQTALMSKNDTVDHNIDLKNLEIPWWWVQKHQLIGKDLGRVNLNRTVRVLFNAIEGVDNHRETTAKITTIKFIPKLTNFKFFNLTFLVVFFTILMAYFWNKRKSEIPTKIVVTAPYNPVDSSIYLNDDEGQLLLYISQNYTNVELTLSKISDDLGIKPRRISEILKNKYEMSFKHYLNQLRISEAKNLLLNTNARVNEVGFSVGFENPQNFLRVFKSFTDLTPSEFRDKEK